MTARVMSIPLACPPLSITQIARRLNLTPRAIRLYEGMGLITAHRDARGVRVFDRAAQDRLSYIAVARKAGLSLRNIADLLDPQKNGSASPEEILVRVARERRTQLDAEQHWLDQFLALHSFSGSKIEAAIMNAPTGATSEAISAG